MAIRHYVLLFLFAELFTLAAVIGEIGFFTTFLLWVLCGFFGLWIIQTQGMGMMLKAQSVFSGGAVPVGNMFDGLCLIVAGLLFLVPGFLGDIVALLLLFPVIRQKINGAGWVKTSTHTTYGNQDGDVIDGSYVRVEEVVEQIAQQDSDTNSDDTETRQH